MFGDIGSFGPIFETLINFITQIFSSGPLAWLGELFSGILGNLPQG